MTEHNKRTAVETVQEAFVAAVQKNGLEHTLRWSVGIAAMISMAAVSTGDCGSLNGSPGVGASSL